MERRRLGRTGIEIAAAALHASWRERDADDGRRVLVEGFERGVDVVVVDAAFDRAIETIVGDTVRALRLRDRAIVATRVGVRPLHPAAVQADVEASLRATRLDAIPLALLRWDDRTFYEKIWPEVRAALARMVREGKVLRWGLWSPVPELAVMGMSDEIFEAIGFQYNLTSPARIAEAFDSARRHQLGVIATAPLAFGRFGGTWHRETTFAPGDWRNEQFPPDAIAKALDQNARLLAAARKEVDSIAELALRYALQAPEVSCVAPSVHTREHLDELDRAADGRRLSASVIERVHEEAERVR